MPGPGGVTNFDIRNQARLRAINSNANRGVGLSYTNSAGRIRLMGINYSYADQSLQYSPAYQAAGPIGRITAINGTFSLPLSGSNQVWTVANSLQDLGNADVLFDTFIEDDFGPKFIDLTGSDDLITDPNQSLTVLIAPLSFVNAAALPGGLSIIATLVVKARRVNAANGSGNGLNSVPTLYPAGGTRP